MIVFFALDPAALALRHLPAPTRVALHEAFVRRWQELGGLVYPATDEGIGALRAAIDALPQASRDLWKRALMSLGRRPGPEGWQGFSADAIAAALVRLQGIAGLVCLDPDAAARAGVGLESMSRQDLATGIEIARYDCAHQARAFEQALGVARGMIEAGETVASIWQKRFAPLAALREPDQGQTRVVVVDPFTAWRLASSGRESGTWRLLEGLESSAQSFRVTVYSAAEEVGMRDWIRGEWAQQMRQREWKRCASLDLVLVDKKAFRRITKDRFVRFGRMVCEIGHGLEVLEGKAVASSTHFTLKPRSLAHKRVEQRLRSAAEAAGWGAGGREQAA